MQNTSKTEALSVRQKNITTSSASFCRYLLQHLPTKLESSVNGNNFPLALGFTPVLPDHSASTLSPCLHITEEEGAEGMAPLVCTAPDIPSASFFTLWGLYLVYYVVQVRNITFFTANIKHVVNHLQACCSGWYACRLLTSTVQTRPQQEPTIQQAQPGWLCSLPVL